MPLRVVAGTAVDVQELPPRLVPAGGSGQPDGDAFVAAFGPESDQDRDEAAPVIFRLESGDEVVFPCEVNRVYPCLAKIVEKVQPEGLSSVRDIAMTLLENGFGPLMARNSEGQTEVFPVFLEDLGIKWLPNGEIPEEGMEDRFYAFPPSGKEGITVEYDRAGDVVVRGLSAAEIRRLSVMTARYLTEGYIKGEHLVKVVDGEGDDRREYDLYVDEFNRRGDQLSMMYNGRLSLRVVLPVMGDNVRIVDTFDEGGSPDKVRTMVPGELPFHSVLREAVPVTEKGLESLVPELSRMDGVVVNGNFLCREAMKLFGIGVGYTYRKGDRSSWAHVFPRRMAPSAELSQLAAPKDEESKEDFLGVASGLLMPLADFFAEKGYLRYLEGKGMTIGLVMSAVPGVAGRLKLFARTLRFGNSVTRLMGQAPAGTITYTQLDQGAEDCLGTKEIPVFLGLVET